MTQVGVVGAAGRMGQEVCRAVSEAADLELVAAVDPEAAGTALRAIAGPAVADLEVSGQLGALVAAGAEVVVDFTVAAAARTNVPWSLEHGLHAVVGTTGLGPEDLDALEGHCAASGRHCVVAPNFAIGAVLMARFAELAAPHFSGAEIVELHHDAKRDAPSGTALQTAARLAAARRAAGRDDLGPDPTTEMVLDGARGGEGPGGVRVHSVRLPGLIAHQEVLFGDLGQSLTIRHDSYDRRSFMAGVLLAVRAVPGRPGLTVGLDLLLGL